MRTCPSDNTQRADPNDDFFAHNFIWDSHRIGWLVAFVSSILTCLISAYPIVKHWRNYTNRKQQRQIIRILYMPPVYAIFSFLAYRFYRHATDFELIQIIYEAIGLSCFLMLIIDYVEEAAEKEGITMDELFERKGKLNLPLPLCFWRYRPSKHYFLHTMKFYVMQHVILRPILSLISIVCEAYNVLCTSEGLLHPEYAYLYISIVDFISISVTLYGLVIYYDTVSKELQGERPLFKFLCIKLIVMLLFYQDIMLSFLGGKFTPTLYWSRDNITTGVSALFICLEMVFFAIAMIWAYPVAPYRVKDGQKTGVVRPIIDSLNMTDILKEIWGSLKFFWGYVRNKPGHRTPKDEHEKDEDPTSEASGLEISTTATSNGRSRGEESWTRSGIGARRKTGAPRPESGTWSETKTGTLTELERMSSGTLSTEEGSSGRIRRKQNVV